MTKVALLILLAAVTAGAHGNLAGATRTVPTPATPPLAAIVFPATLSRESLISDVHWQGLPVTVEVLDIGKSLHAFLEELAGIIPAASLLYGQDHTMVAHWVDGATSFLMNMQSNGEHNTRAMISSILLRPDIGVMATTAVPSQTSSPADAGRCGLFSTRDGAPGSQMSPLFAMRDWSVGAGAQVAAYSMTLPSGIAASHVRKSLRRQGWTVFRHDVLPTGTQGPWFTLEASCGQQRARVDVWSHRGQTRVLSYKTGDLS